ncbi:MAG: thioredoxin domain-containing protein [Terriglobales bacterium]
MTGLLLAQSAQDHHNPTDAELKARIHAFLNRSLGWQGLDKLVVESISAPDPSGLRTATVLLAKGTQQKTSLFLITADGREIIEGEAQPLSVDPWAANRAKLRLRGAPAMGKANAPVTVVEFSDLECPYCREEAAGIDQLMDVDPGQARIIFKYFPLTKIHPWSMDAAEAAVCVAAQGSTQFWNFERAVFADQAKITPEDAKVRLRDFAGESGANLSQYDACLQQPSTHADVEASIANGKALGVTSTPTLFIDGRLIPGAIPEQQLQLLVDHEATFPAADRGADPNFGGHIAGKQCGSCTPLPPLPKSKGTTIH